MKRVILHSDLNCFYASVEMLYHPELRHVPMAVAGDSEKRHGIILAKNPLAKKYGIRTAESIMEAKRKCPELVLCPADYHSYQYFSQRVKDLYAEYTDRVESFGPDECWLDITGSIRYFRSREEIVSQLLERIRKEIGLTLSIGVSFNKTYAKLGSDLAEDDSFFVIDSTDDIRDLPASLLFGVGPSTSRTLCSYGFHTIGDLADSSPEELHSLFGKWGDDLYFRAAGLDRSEVKRIDAPKEEARSIGHSSTGFRDLYNEDDLRLVLRELSDRVASRLREQGLYFKCVKLSLRDRDLKKRTLQRNLEENSDLAQDIFRTALSLFQEHCDFSVPYRSIGVSVSALSPHKDISPFDLFSTESGCRDREKERKEELALEEIRRRFGSRSITRLRSLEDRRLSGLEDEP